MNSDAFNPLLSAGPADDEILEVQRRSLQNVAESYHRTYDVFAELLQNAVDAVYQRYGEGDSSYNAKIWVDLDLARNEINVTDNGTGISEDQFRRVLAPHVSFKDFRVTGSKRYRGHKGVGLSYVAYGFNYIRISTRDKNGEGRSGMLENGRRWVTGDTETVPHVVGVSESNDVFQGLDRGTSITVRLDETTVPKSLPHIATSPDAWEALLRVQTALGRVFYGDGSDIPIEATLVVRKEGDTPSSRSVETQYLFPHRASTESFKYLDLVAYYTENKDAPKVPAKYRLRDGIFVFWDTKELLDRLGTDETVTETKEIVQKRQGWVYGFMAYSSEYWAKAKPQGFPRARLLEPGVAIGSDNMIIGDAREISLTRYIGRQQQVLCVVHFDGLRPDLGRKSFEREIEDAAQRIAQRVVTYFGEGDRFRLFLRASPSKAPADKKEKDLQDWILDATKWASGHELTWGNRRLALVSEPQQEQDVVILFSQMVSGGLLPGYRLYSTAEGNRQYDCILKVDLQRTDVERFSIDHPEGIEDAAFHGDHIETKALVLEFKLLLSDLIGDFLDTSKRFKDIDVAVAWDLGPRFSKGVASEWELRTVSTDDTVTGRPYPGITHRLVHAGSEDQIWVIVLRDLFMMANNWDKGIAEQLANYPD